MNVIVFKIGGSVLADLPKSFFKMLVHLKESNACQPVIVHGGGPEINQALANNKVDISFIEGLRVTSKEVLHVVEMVLSGSVNKQIVSNIYRAGGNAIGLSGVDGAQLITEPLDPSGKLGYVGKVTKVNTDWLKLVIENGGIPVLSPIGIGMDGQKYNINGDTASAAVAKALKGKLALISDIPGVKEKTKTNEVKVHPFLTGNQVEKMIREGVIYGGMIPKVRSALSGLAEGVSEAIILNGLNPTDISDFVNGKQVGTRIYLDERNG